jgi:7-cyano-7-deazaguanine reductase
MGVWPKGAVAGRGASPLPWEKSVSAESNENAAKKLGKPAYRDMLEVFDNQFPDREYEIEIVCPEFTSVCPKTGQPDFGVLTITYVPAAKCVELKSLKLYLQQFRNEGIFYEHATNCILDDLATATQPRRMKLKAAFTPRGGITTTVTCVYEAKK